MSRNSRRGGRRRISVSVRVGLLTAAREAGVDLSVTLERALAAELAIVKRKQWLQQNREAIAAYNEHVDAYRTFSDDVRSFPNYGKNRVGREPGRE